MSESKNITRRDAIKYIGATAIGTGLGLGSAAALNNMNSAFTNRKMKVLLVNGSPNKEGCTFTALSEIATTLNFNGIETEIFQVGKRPISGCIACGACSSEGRCFINDRVNEFLNIAGNYDGFVFGSPVHFAAMSGSMTSFMDRAFFCARASDIMAGRPAATIASCRRSGSTTTLDQLNKYPIHRGMPLVPSQYWPMVYGNRPEEVRQDSEGLQIMRTLAQNMAWMMQCIEAGRQAGIFYPEREPRVATNFIR